jgi:hypothetical protein
MKSTLFIALFSLGFGINLCSQNFEWAARMGGTGSDGAKCIAADPAGNVYTVGTFSSSANFMVVNADTSITSPIVSLSTTCFICKHNNAGELLWVKNLGDGIVEIGDIALDGLDNIYLSGRFNTAVDFDPDTGVQLVVPNVSQAFLLKLDSNAHFLWVKTTDANSGSLIRIEAMEIDDSSNIVFGGHILGTVDMDFGPGVHNLAGGSFGLLVGKFDSGGNFLWAHNLSSNTAATSVALDPAGNILLKGTFSGNTDFDPGPSVANLSGSGTYILKLSASGNFIWVKGISTGIGTVDQYHAMVTDYLGDIYMIGTFLGTVDFDPGWDVHNLTSIGTQDIFMLKLSQFGDYLWANHFGPADPDFTSVGIDIDYYQNIFVTGQFAGTVDFDPGVGVSERTSDGPNSDLFIAKYNGLGEFFWVESIGNYRANRPVEMEVTDNGSIYLATNYSLMGIDVDPGPGSIMFTNQGIPETTDLLLLKLKDSTSVVGMETFNPTDPFVVYPNPFYNDVTINGIDEPTQIILFSSLGEQIGSWKLNADNSTIPIYGLKPGIYFLQLQTKTHLITKKMIKN